MTKKQGEKNTFFQWLRMSPQQRFMQGWPSHNISDMARCLKVCTDTAYDWQKEFNQLVDPEPPKAEEAKTGEITSDELKRWILAKSMDPKASSKDRELGAKIIGLLDQQQKIQVKVELTADELTRRNLEAERQLREAGYRVEEVQSKSALLPENIREDTPS